MLIFFRCILSIFLFCSIKSKADNVAINSGSFNFLLSENDIVLSKTINCIKAPCNSMKIDEIKKENLKNDDYNSHFKLYYNINKIFFLKFKHKINCQKNQCKVFLLSDLLMQSQIENALKLNFIKDYNLSINMLTPNDEHKFFAENLSGVKKKYIKQSIILDIKKSELYLSVFNKKISTILVSKQNFFSSINLKLRKYNHNLKFLTAKTFFNFSNEIIKDLNLAQILKQHDHKLLDNNKELAIIIRDNELYNYYKKEFAGNLVRKEAIINKISFELMQLYKIIANTEVSKQKLNEIYSLLYVYSLIKFFRVDIFNIYSNHDLLMTIKALNY